VRPTIDEYWIAMLPLIASRGTCPRRQVSCILVDERGRLVATGYNGNPPGSLHCTESPCPGSPVVKGLRMDCEAVHAELNAVIQAGDSRRTPWTAYCSLTPCRPCAAALLSIGVKRVVALERYKYDNAGPALLAKAGVMLDVVKEEAQ
jgi:dCMP deaminase